MKKIYVYLALIAVLFSACKKKNLDLFPYNQIETSQAFNTETDVNLALGGAYSGLRGMGNYKQGEWNIVYEVISDNVIINEQGRLSQQVFHNWQYKGNATVGLFSQAYSVIRRTNAILENIDNVPSTPTFVNNVKGQALALRALLHFEMARVYSKTFNLATNADSTVPFITTTDPTILPAKISVKEMYDKIVLDLTTAEPLIATSNGVGRLNRAAVQGILSKVYLYMGDWPKAIASATSALGATPNLPNIATFPSIWTDATETGVLFKTKNTLLDNSNTLGVNYYQTVAGGIRSEYNVDYDFYQLFANNDVRKSSYTLQAAYNGTNYNHVVKYAGKTGFPAGVLDAKILRTAEVLLNRAEAYYRNNNEAAALADLVLLKTNRYTGYVAEVLAGTALLNEIMLQRRLELAFEGERFFDLKRWGMAVTRSGKGDKADGTGTPSIFQSIPAGDYRFNFPLPDSELNFNKNLKQVPGYNN
ncbi:RagB/SusD family nutrient uptake outer membrane protein [Lacibacter sp.]|uniref:RagB/SusD family nutrient uptake outer membrane protein n=1 Tax=Lacibacter sp. TaxID=1915409 RepID=UPI002B4B0DF6|nr:RagB/SusD family nutrient uptake outer membrane protein [Lacibacter sp.]HLP37384.1 RagB/SusD family nutrient uptake outer membrane protein [Lacibacter sp.]